MAQYALSVRCSRRRICPKSNERMSRILFAAPPLIPLRRRRWRGAQEGRDGARGLHSPGCEGSSPWAAGELGRSDGIMEHRGRLPLDRASALVPRCSDPQRHWTFVTYRDRSTSFLDSLTVWARCRTTSSTLRSDWANSLTLPPWPSSRSGSWPEDSSSDIHSLNVRRR